MTILVTRPEPGASRTLAALESKGLRAISAPLFNVTATGAPRPSGRFAALIVTSANGAAELTPAAADLAADLPVFAVGDRTAEAVRAHGFTNVTSASGDQKALTRLVLAKLPPRFRVLLATGEDHKDGLPAAFAAAGHEIALWLRYRAEPVPALPEAAREALASGGIDTVLHYSRRASETYVRLAREAGLEGRMGEVKHLALSSDVAEPLLQAGLSHIIVAPQPDEEHMLDRLTEADLPAGPDAAGPGPDRPIEAETGADATGSAAGAASAPDPAAAPSDEPGRRAAGRARKHAVTPVTRSGVAGVAVPPEPASFLPAASADAAAAPHEPSDARADAAADVSPRPLDRDITKPSPLVAPEAGGSGMAAQAAAASPFGGAAGVAAPTPRGGIGWGALIAASLVSGLVGAAAYGALWPTLAPMLGRPAPGPAGAPQAASPQPATSSPALAALTERIARLEAPRPAPEAQLPAGAREALQQAGAQAAQQRQQIEALERRIGELAARPAQPAADPAAVDELRKRLAEAEVAAKALAPRLAEVEQRSQQAAAPSRPATAAAKLIITDRLARALADGRPFESEIAALGALGAPAEPLATLKSFASRSAPTLAELITGFRSLRGVFAAEPADPDAPWYERLLRMTDGLVRVRSTGAVEGTSPPAVTARMDQALQRGDIAAAIEAFGTLPEPARRAGEAWIAAARQRASADRAIRTISDDAIKALSSAP